jgi:hypothetical protein
MEEVVALKHRTKKHTEPHRNNELKALMDHLRSAEVNTWRPSRNKGFQAIDDFAKGLDVLQKDKIKNFITRTTAYLDVLGLHNTSHPEDLLNEEDLEDATHDWDSGECDELPSHRSYPPPQMATINGELCMVNREDETQDPEETEI